MSSGGIVIGAGLSAASPEGGAEVSAGDKEEIGAGIDDAVGSDILLLPMQP